MINTIADGRSTTVVIDHAGENPWRATMRFSKSGSFGFRRALQGDSFKLAEVEYLVSRLILPFDIVLREANAAADLQEYDKLEQLVADLQLSQSRFSSNPLVNRDPLLLVPGKLANCSSSDSTLSLLVVPATPVKDWLFRADLSSRAAVGFDRYEEGRRKGLARQVIMNLVSHLSAFDLMFEVLAYNGRPSSLFAKWVVQHFLELGNTLAEIADPDNAQRLTVWPPPLLT